jgi:hypothetical protein
MLIVLAGIIRFAKVKKAIEHSRRNIGNASDAFIKTARGTEE